MPVLSFRRAWRLWMAASAAATLLGVPRAARAQAPRTLAIQGVLADASGKPKPNATYNVTFRLFDAATGGNLLWTEAGKPVVVSGGKGGFATALGTPTAFGVLAFDRPYFLEVQVAGDAAMTPRLALQGAPYAVSAWNTGGNAGTNPATRFLGTTDNTPLVLRVNSRRAILLEDKADAGNTYHTVNVLAGAASNTIAAGVMGATIAGGGQDMNAGADVPNDVRGNFGAIGGGSGNFIDAFAFATIAGGAGNIVQGNYSTVTGGFGNNTQSEYTTIAGGTQNFTSGASSTVGGGSSNSITAGLGTIAGGDTNSVTASLGTIAGGNGNTASGNAGAVGGGQGNTAGGAYAVVGGGFQNINGGQYGTISGGAQNQATGFLATVAGGSQNRASAQYAAVGGGSRNAAGGDTATIGGGDQNTVNGTFTSIGGGRQNYGWSASDFSAIAGGFSNTVYGDFAAIPGGYRNSADGLASFAAGYRAYAAHDGSFVWADAHEADFASTAANQFLVRAAGGIVLETFTNVPIYTGIGTGEANRYVLLLNSPRAPSASGLKAGGILCADSFAYANPGKNDMVVKGTLGVGYPNPAPYTFAVNGTVYSAGGYSSSDARYKRNVHALDGSLDTVRAMRGVSFEWDRARWQDHNFPEGRQIGFIAQEVETVLPAAVVTDPHGFKAVSYQSVVPVLVEAVKALETRNERMAAEKDAQIAALQERQVVLERQQAELNQRLRALEEHLSRPQPAE